MHLVDRKSISKPKLIYTNLNCMVSGIMMVLYPIYLNCKIKDVIITTFQSISGLGYYGLDKFMHKDMSLYNTLDLLEEEENKIKNEMKIFCKIDLNIT